MPIQPHYLHKLHKDCCKLILDVSIQQSPQCLGVDLKFSQVTISEELHKPRLFTTTVSWGLQLYYGTRHPTKKFDSLWYSNRSGKIHIPVHQHQLYYTQAEVLYRYWQASILYSPTFTIHQESLHSPQSQVYSLSHLHHTPRELTLTSKPGHLPNLWIVPWPPLLSLQPTHRPPITKGRDKKGTNNGANRQNNHPTLANFKNKSGKYKSKYWPKQHPFK